ncbi:MAG TPA: BatA domain-containing protein [Planctomycetaceae bacterium]|nr:BatA domain-containing protein [Planctomycetaceae bacterium]
MSFLQPWLLAALPLVALPIIIHLINQRRYQTVRWGAMMFLLTANRMARGFARLRQYLIMAARMLAIAGLVFAVSRPLASGWLGLAAGGRPDTTIIVLDRSPSMQQKGIGGGDSKLATGVHQLAQTLATLKSAHWILIDSVTKKPVQLDSPEALLKSPAAEPTSAASDLPGLLEAAYEYTQANKSGRTDIWICSDLRQNDWNPRSGRWQALRESLLSLRQGVRINLLAYPEAAEGNFSVRVSDVRRVQNGPAADLVLSVRLAREGEDQSRASIPLHFEIDGARTEVMVEMDKSPYELKDYRIPLESKQPRSWGKVTIPADLNPADNDFYFAFEKPVPRHAIVVVEDNQVARSLQLAAAITPDPGITCSAEVVAAEQVANVEWEKVSLLVWQGPLPEGDAARHVQEFIKRGGYAIFLPPKVPGDREFLAAKWKSWTDSASKDALVANWRGDQDLLANTQSGAQLPVGQLQIHRYCQLAGDFTPLAGLQGGSPLLARSTQNHSGAYFLATTTSPADSSLATDGVVLYVLVQRAMAAGAASLGTIRQLAAGEALPANLPDSWQRLAGPEDALSGAYPVHRGVYLAGDQLLAINRPMEEDQAPILDDGRVADLFAGLNFIRVDHRAGHIGILIEEIWRPFLFAMIVALIVEAALCLPRYVAKAGSPS